MQRRVVVTSEHGAKKGECCTNIASRQDLRGTGVVSTRCSNTTQNGRRSMNGRDERVVDDRSFLRFEASMLDRLIVQRREGQTRQRCDSFDAIEIEFGEPSAHF
jgi:hypothetical protein